MENLVFFYPQGHARHFQYGHPEQPERVEAVRRVLEQAGWWGAYPQLDALGLPEEILLSVHTGSYLEDLQLLCAEGASLDFDTYTTPASWQLARNAAGGAAAVAAAVWRREGRRGFCADPSSWAPCHPAAWDGVLPAEQRSACGRIPGAAQGAETAGNRRPRSPPWKRNPGYFLGAWGRIIDSTHQMPLYPGTGYFNEFGSGAGVGQKTANIPMPPYAGDQAFTDAMQEVILPLLDRFQAEMLLVSVGFDTHWRDPLGSLKLSAAVYGVLVREAGRRGKGTCDGTHCPGPGRRL